MKKIILVGPAASGKSFILSKLIEKGFSNAIWYTTRPIREGEQDGIDYNFISESEFELMLKNNEFKQYDKFNDWYYGLTHTEFDNKEVVIMTPGGIKKLSDDDIKQLTIIYLDIPEKVRRNRLNIRNDTDSVERRMKADKKDFKDFTIYDIRIVNHTINVSEVLNLIYKLKCKD